MLNLILHRVSQIFNQTHANAYFVQFEPFQDTSLKKWLASWTYPLFSQLDLRKGKSALLGIRLCYS